MLVVADSGSTKTDWKVIKENGDILSFETVGFNPYFVTSSQVLTELESSTLNQVKSQVKKVFFYGAGCSSVSNCNIISNPLRTFFCHAVVEVDHDLLAAARSVCADTRGIVAILGTGSNSCVFDGNKITDNIPALGYLLGDYGGGADLGKTLIKFYLEKELPKDLSKKFDEKYQLDTSSILSEVYHQDFPNRFLANFNLFIAEHINHSFIQDMVKERMSLFFEKNICKYDGFKDEKLHFVGSIAFIYKTIIQKVASRYGVELGNIVRKPIDGLVDYHCSERI